MFYSFYYSTRRGPFEKMYGALFSLRGKKTGVTGWAQKKVRKRPTLPPPTLSTLVYVRCESFLLHRDRCFFCIHSNTYPCLTALIPNPEEMTA